MLNAMGHRSKSSLPPGLQLGLILLALLGGESLAATAPQEQGARAGSLAVDNSPADLASGWGIMAAHTTWWPRLQWNPLRAKLLEGGIQPIREQSPVHPNLQRETAAFRRHAFKESQARGLRVIAISTGALRAAERLPGAMQGRIDLLSLYHRAREYAAFYGDSVTAWELLNEPDFHFFKGPPDEAAAVAKVLYLGLKKGSRGEAIDGVHPGDISDPEATPVVSSSLAFAPGPWAKRAARNGLFLYGDAYNYHYYGAPEYLAQFHQHHQQFLSDLYEQGLAHVPEMPFWITEINFAQTDFGDKVTESQRQRNGRQNAEAAQTASDLGVAVFMPFAARWARVKSSLDFFDAHLDPYPAWHDYTDVIKERGPLTPEHGFSMPPEAVSPVILQWVPARDKSLVHKVSGSYRFTAGDNKQDSELAPIEGWIGIYNLAAEPVSGTLHLPSHRAGLSTEPSKPVEPRERRIELDALSSTFIPVTFPPPAPGTYHFAEHAYSFIIGQPSAWAGSPPSRLLFAVETDPASVPFEEAPLGLTLPQDLGAISTPPLREEGPPYMSDLAPPFVGLDGLVLSEPVAAGAYRFAGRAFTRPRGAFARHRAVASLPNGLPENPEGFLVLSVDPWQKKVAKIRLYLVDQDGQRYTISENRGVPRYREDASETYLRLADFHPASVGAITEWPELDLGKVREIQLVFTFREYLKPFPFNLTYQVPRASTTRKTD
jgi:hypothetical protein